MKFLFQIFLAFLVWEVVYPQANLTDKAAASLKTYFGDSVEVVSRVFRFSEEEKLKIQLAQNSKTNIDSISLFICTSSGQRLGYGILDNVKGKSQPITYLTVIDTLGDVVDVNILVYRESHGGEVQNESFRRQFRGMNAKSKIDIGRDIKSISGATISSRSVTGGVKNVIRIFEIIRPSLNQ
ncbi:MAG: FMN-binding protein [Bacteroidota bacterium]|nr:FMN-binding protein [Bacteroidota bacterium]